MPLGKILEKSFKYPWENRALWFYGVLIAIFSGGSNISNQFDTSDTEKIKNVFNVNPQITTAVVVLLGLAALAVGILGIIISSWSQISLMKGVQLADKNKKFSRKEIGKTGKTPVWNYIKLNILLPLAVVLAVLLIGVVVGFGLSLLHQIGLVIGIILAVLFVLALIPLGFYLSVLFPVANRFIGLEGKKAIESLKTARELIKGKFWISFLTFLILSLISGTATLVLLMPFVAIVLTIVAFVAAKIVTGIAIGVLIALLYLIFYVIAFGYILSVNQTGVTLWFFELRKKPLVGKAAKLE